MLIKAAADIPSSDITDKRLYMNRRAFIQSATGAALSMVATVLGAEALVRAAQPAPHGAAPASVGLRRRRSRGAPLLVAREGRRTAA